MPSSVLYIEFSILLSNGFFFFVCNNIISSGITGNNSNIEVETGCWNCEPVIKLGVFFWAIR